MTTVSAQSLQTRREAWARNRLRQTIERWRTIELLECSPQAEASLARWILTGRCFDPLAGESVPAP